MHCLPESTSCFLHLQYPLQSRTQRQQWAHLFKHKLLAMHCIADAAPGSGEAIHARSWPLEHAVQGQAGPTVDFDRHAALFLAVFDVHTHSCR